MSDTSPMNIDSDDEDGRAHSGSPDANPDADMIMNAGVPPYVDAQGWFFANEAANIAPAQNRVPVAFDTEVPAAIIRPNEMQHPRTNRFTDVQIRSDDQMIQNLMNVLQNHLHEQNRPVSRVSHDVSASGMSNSTVESIGPPSVDNHDASDLSNQHNPEHQRSQFNLSSSVNAPSLFHTAGVTDSGPSAQESDGHSYMNEPSQGSCSTNPSRLPVGSGEPSGDHQSETVNITQRDFMRFVRGVENLSLNVQTLLGRGPNTPPSSGNSFSASTGNTDPPRDDGDHGEAMKRNHKKKSIEENRYHDVLRNLLVDHGLWISRQREQLTLKETVPKVEIDDYEAGLHDGPTLDDLRMDWTEPMSSQWNTAAIYILTRHVLDRLKNNHYPELRYEDWMTTKRTFGEFKAKLSVSKEEYVGVAAANAPATDIDAAVNRARYDAKKRVKKIKNRRNMRRKTLYECRLRIIAENLGSHPGWENALQLMLAIGDLAMSDDETDSERSTRRKKVVRRVEKQWASAPFKILLNTLDLYYSRFYYDGFHKPGPGPRDRLTTIVSESPRPTPRNLPRNCYNDMYIISLREHQRSLLQCKRDMIIPTLPLPPV